MKIVEKKNWFQFYVLMKRISSNLANELNHRTYERVKAIFSLERHQLIFSTEDLILHEGKCV